MACRILHQINRHDITITTHAIKRHFLIWMTMVRQPTKHRRSCVIQIKICAEYRDMLPRPMLVCQEPDESSRGLGGMSRYSAQILICFIYSIHCPFFNPLWVWMGTLQDCQYAQLPSAFVHCNQNEAGHQTIKAPSMPC